MSEWWDLGRPAYILMVPLGEHYHRPFESIGVVRWVMFNVGILVAPLPSLVIVRLV